MGCAPWGPRFVQAIAAGCVPVVFADGDATLQTVRPFEHDGLVAYAKFVVTVHTAQLASLRGRLDDIMANRTRLAAMQSEMRVAHGSLLYQQPWAEEGQGACGGQGTNGRDNSDATQACGASGSAASPTGDAFTMVIRSLALRVPRLWRLPLRGY